MEGRRPIVSIKKACEIAGVSRRTMYNWIMAGKVQYIRNAGGGVRIFADTLFRDQDGRPLGREELRRIEHGAVPRLAMRPA